MRSCSAASSAGGVSRRRRVAAVVTFRPFKDYSSRLSDCAASAMKSVLCGVRSSS